MDVALEKPVLFVVGSGRSGTTLVYELICAHPRAAWISNYSQRSASLARFNPPVPRAFKQGGHRWARRPVEGYRLYDRVRPDSGSEPQLTSVDLTDPERRRLREAVAAHLRPRRVRFFVNKNTRNSRRVGYLAAAFPEARFVHVVRHPIPAAASLARVEFFPGLPAFWRDGQPVSELLAAGGEPELLAAELWAYETASCRAALAQLPPHQAIELRYEELVQDPHGRMQAVMHLVGQEVSESMRSEITARSIIDRNVRGVRELTADVRSGIWRIAGPEAAQHGYRPA